MLNPGATASSASRALITCERTSCDIFSVTLLASKTTIFPFEMEKPVVDEKRAGDLDQRGRVGSLLEYQDDADN
jgi:hypothetical protein